jgi:hypothetical protein
MNKKTTPLVVEEEDDLVRCRRVREELSRRFKTEEEMLAFVEGLEKKYGVTKRGRAVGPATRPKRQAPIRPSPPKAALTRSGR